jgi:FAD synthetase
MSASDTIAHVSSLETDATNSNIPNWRVLHKNESDVDKILSVRAPWSQRQYQDSLRLHDALVACSDSYVAPGTQEALKCLDHAYRLYGPESVVVSYNGGKDAVVILHLLRAAHAHYHRQHCGTDAPIIRPRAIYFDHKDEFPEVLKLLHDTVQDYDLDMICFEQGIGFSDGLEILVSHNYPRGSTVTFPMAFVLGTRSSDPNAHSQGHFAPSSHYMPPFMRVNPILEWTYGHVWHFLRLFQLPYCCLYDMGYTSLGTVKDTRPCPALAVAGVRNTTGDGVPKYWPAYMLRDWDQERAGRITKKDAKKSKPEKQMVSQPGTTASSVGQYSTLSNAVASTIVDPAPSATIPPSTGNTAPPSEQAISDLVTPPMSFSSNDNQRTVGLLIIGNEILKGLTADTNTLTAAKALWNNTVQLNRVVVVSDDQEEIVAEVRRLQEEVDVIITSGGVGPTHDDVTIKSVAAALDRKMVFNHDMAKLLREKMNTNDTVELTEAQRKMATLPANCTLRYLSDNEQDWPVLQCRNIFVLPGVPEFFEKKIQNLASYLSTQLERSATYKVVLSVDEASIVDALNTAVERHPHVTFGSYPFVSHPEFKTVVTLEGRMVQNSGRDVSFEESADGQEKGQALFSKEQMDYHVQAALDELIGTLPEGSILRVDNNDGMLFL